LFAVRLSSGKRHAEADMRRLLILLTLLTTAAAPAPTSPDTRMNARVFDRVWTLVAKRYWDPTLHGVDWQAARASFRPQALAARDNRTLYEVIERMLDRIGDSHVYAYSPTQTAGSDDGSVGFVSVIEDGAWRVLSVDRDSPAARAGVMEGWQLLSIDGQVPARDDPPPANGALQTYVFVDATGARRAIPLRAVQLPPDQIVDATRLAGNVLLLRIDDFDPGIDRWVFRQLSQAPRAVILDLRENDGGDAAVTARVAGAFFAKKRVMLVRTGRDAGEDEVRATGDRAYSGPLVVLVGRRSASAAEAFAALIGGSGRGTTVGERTAGALTGAEHFRLPDGGELSVATSDVHMPDGMRIEGVGYKPEITVPWPVAGRRVGIDPQLERALATLSS
jgi:carboxyl-terminal processing protease